MRLGKLIEGLFALLIVGCELSSLVSLCNVEGLMDFLEELFSFHVIQLSINICAEVFVLDALPLVSVILGAVKSEFDLLWSELSVLAHSIQADNILQFFGQVRLSFDLRPVAVVSRIFMTICLNVFLSLPLLIFMINLCHLLLSNSVSAAESVSNSLVIRLNRQARVVLHSDCHVRAQSRHLEEVHTRLTHDFLDQDVIKLVCLNWLSFLIHLVIEDVKCEATSLGQHLVDQERVLFIRMREVNDFIFFIIDMRLVIVSFLDGFFGAHQFANVDCRSICKPFEVICQLLQVVIKVVGLSDVLLKFILVILNLLLRSLLLDTLHGFCGILFSELGLGIHHTGFLFFARLSLSLHLRVVEEPL